MNYRKLMLAAIVLLAILTIGAVSASDDVGNLTATDLEEGAVELSDAPVDESEVIALDSQNQSVGNDSEKYNVTLTVNRPDVVYYNDELYIYAEADPADEECGEFPSGEVVLYLNGEEVDMRPLWDSSFYFEIDEFGVYDFKMEYMGDENFNGASEEFTYNVTNTMYNIRVSSEISYGAKEFRVYAPVYNPSNIEITINGKKFKVYDDYEDLFCNASELSYGLNTVDIYYPGDEYFGEYSASANITVESYIRVDSEEHILGEPVVFYLNVPSDATGTLTVYSRVEGDYDEWIDTEIASAQVKNGNATVILTDVPVGVPMFYANFTGSVEVPDASYWMSIMPIVTVPKAMIAGEDAYVVVKTATNTPDSVEVLYVEYEEDMYYEWEDYTKLGPVPVLNNQSNVSLAGLKEGYYEVYVLYYYEGGEGRFADRFYLYVLDEYDINLNITYLPENVIVDDKYNYVDYNIASYAEGIVTLYIDGNAVANRTADGRDTFMFSSEGLSIGEHTLSVNFTSETQPASSDAGKFNVVAAAIYIPDKSIINSLHMSANNIEVHVSENATGIIAVFIDGEIFKSQAVDAPATEKVYYVVFLNEVSRGKHNVSVLFMDEKYGEVQENKTVDFGYDIQIYSEGIYGQDNIITLILPNDIGNGDLTINLDGNKITGTRNASTVTANPSVLAMGNHTVVVKYAGDNFYPADEFNYTFEVFTEIRFPYGDILVGTDKGVSLTLPEDAKGKLNVTVEVEEYDDIDDMEFWAIYDNKLVSFENGTAYYSFASLPIGYYRVSASYTGNDYEVYENENTFSVDAVDWGNEYLDMGENKTITFISRFDDPGQLRIVLSRIVDERKEWDHPVNVAEELVINFTGKVSHTFTNLKHGHYHIFIAEEYVNGPLKGYQGGFDFFVESPVTESESGEFVIGTIPPIVIKFPDNANGTVTVTVHTNLTKEVYDLYKTANVPVNGLTSIDLNKIIADTGKYRVFFNYTGNYGEFDGYDLVYNVISDEPISPNIVVNATQNVVVGDDVVFNISSPVASLSKVVVSIGGKEYDALPVLGKSTITVSGLAGGKYDANVTFVGDLIYKSESKIIPITVAKLSSPQIVIDVAGIPVEGNNLTVVVTIDNATGIVNINGENITLLDGKATATIKNVASGELPIDVVYYGSDKYLDAFNSTKVNVYPKLDVGLTATANDIKVGQVAVIDISFNLNVSGVVFVGDKEVIITNGKGKFEIPNLPIGTYKYDVSFKGGLLYLDANVTVSFSVTTDPVITMKQTTALYTGTYSVTVYGNDGNLAKNTDVVFYINDKKVKAVKTNENGVATFNLPSNYLPTKQYTIKATALGKSASKKVTVKHLVTLKTVTVKKSAKKIVLQATLAKVNGKYLKNKKITFKFNGKTYKNIKTNSKGVAKLTIKNAKSGKNTYNFAKLKAGKKITYMATYLKDTVKKTAKVKK